MNEVINEIHSFPGIFGLSDHDLIYSQEATESLEELEQSSANHEAIQARVWKDILCFSLSPHSFHTLEQGSKNLYIQ